MDIQALGLIEVKGFLGAIAVADAALKTANVQLINAEKISGGLTTIQVSGDVAAVQVAVAAGSAVASDLNCLKSSHVIPRLAAETAQMVIDSIEKQAVAPVEKPIEKQLEVDVTPVAEAPTSVTVKQPTETISSEAAPVKGATKKVTEVKKSTAPKSKKKK